MIIDKGKIDDIDEIEDLYSELNDILEQGINYPGCKKRSASYSRRCNKGN